MKINESLSLKVILILVSTILFSISILAIYIYRSEKTKLYEDLYISAHQISERIVNSLSAPIWNIDKKQINETITLEMLNINIRAIILSVPDLDEKFVFVKNNTGQIIKKIFTPELKKSISNKNTLYLQNFVKRQGSLLFEKLGKVEIYMTDKFLKETQLKTVVRRLASLLIIFCVILVTTLYYIFQKIILKRLSLLQQVVQKFKINNKIKTLPEKPYDEIGKLTASFNSMAKQLVSNFNNINKLNIELEHRVEERTLELKKSLGNLRNAQVQLVLSEKMAALGNLVAGISHEINTPLGIAITANSFLEDEIQKINQLYSNKKMTKLSLQNFIENCKNSNNYIAKNLERAAELIRSFKMVAVDQTVEEKRSFEFKKYLLELLTSLKPKLKKGKHELTIDCDNKDENLIIYSFPGIFAQIITNLVINALLHGYQEDTPGKMNLHFLSQDNTLTLHFTDNGKGIAEENLSKIFEPFFTTKRNKGGTGLGLHIIFNLVTQKLKGTIECQSRLGEGTTFIIKVPIEKNKK